MIERLMGKERKEIGGWRREVADLRETKSVVAQFQALSLAGKLREKVEKEEMKEAVKESEKLIAEHRGNEHIEKVRPRTNRFAGEVAMREGGSEEAVEKFDKRIRIYEQRDKLSEKRNALELRRFRAEALIRSGGAKTKIGVLSSIETFEDYDESEEGQWLKELLEKSRDNLENPPESADMWGDVSIRLEEIDTIKDRLDE